LVNQVGGGLAGVTPAVTDLIVDPSRPQVLHEAAIERSVHCVGPYMVHQTEEANFSAVPA
jgi:hypothetical protein